MRNRVHHFPSVASPNGPLHNLTGGQTFSLLARTMTGRRSRALRRSAPQQGRKARPKASSSPENRAQTSSSTDPSSAHPGSNEGRPGTLLWLKKPPVRAAWSRDPNRCKISALWEADAKSHTQRNSGKACAVCRRGASIEDMMWTVKGTSQLTKIVTEMGSSNHG